MDKDTVLTRENFFKYSRCAWCGSQDMLELDVVKPFAWPPSDIWAWDVWKRDSYILTECQVLCNPCYLRKKRLWKSYKAENAEWFKKFPPS